MNRRALEEPANAVAVHLDATVVRRAETVAYWYQGESLTYAEFGDRVACTAAAFEALGVRCGDRVATLIGNDPRYFVVSQAIWRLGAVLVPINVLLSLDEMLHILRDSGASCLVIDEHRHHRALDMHTDSPQLRIVSLSRTVAEPSITALEDLSDAVDMSAAPRALTGDRLAVIAYTSGTTGFPKGAMLDDRHLFEAMANASEHLVLTENDNILQALPVHSIAPCLIGGWLSTFLGSTCALLQRFDVGEVVDAVARYRIACFAMVPTMLFDLLRGDAAREPDFSSVRYIQAGGAAVPDSIRQDLAQRFNIQMIKSYGSTECSYVSLDHPGVLPPPAASGQVLAHIDLTVRDPDGTVLERNAVGELCVGPSARGRRPFRPILGYWNDPAKTAEALADGVFHTGDIGYIDDQDFVYVVDRLKDMIIRGGNNVYPAELERVLGENPLVESAYVVGIPDPRLGEVPFAFVVAPSAGPGTLEEILAGTNARLARFKRIEGGRLIAPEDLPVSAMNKVLKRELVALALRDHEHTVVDADRV
jgi:acyl-CoA synthetase (AMP-forming)/AMP-acid ligase II